MDYPQVVDVVKNLGVPVALLVWIFWRGDYFLRYFVGKLDIFNDELNNINISLKELTSSLKK